MGRSRGVRSAHRVGVRHRRVPQAGRRAPGRRRFDGSSTFRVRLSVRPGHRHRDWCHWRPKSPGAGGGGRSTERTGRTGLLAESGDRGRVGTCRHDHLATPTVPDFGHRGGVRRMVVLPVDYGPPVDRHCRGFGYQRPRVVARRLVVQSLVRCRRTGLARRFDRSLAATGHPPPPPLPGGLHRCPSRHGGQHSGDCRAPSPMGLRGSDARPAALPLHRRHLVGKQLGWLTGVPGARAGLRSGLVVVLVAACPSLRAQPGARWLCARCGGAGWPGDHRGCRLRPAPHDVLVAARRVVS